jgi:hypothetical protein
MAAPARPEAIDSDGSPERPAGLDPNICCLIEALARASARRDNRAQEELGNGKQPR